MNAAQVQKLLSEYGEENLIFISMNNNRRIHIDDEFRAKMVWDHTNELLTFEEDDYVLHEMRNFQPRKVSIIQGYDMLEAFIFARDDDSKLKYGLSEETGI
jgi:hypothetical protein